MEELMPEYSQIQTYVKYNKEKFRLIISQYTDVLTALGFDKGYIHDNFSEAVWEVETDGYAYVCCNTEMTDICIRNTIMRMRPFLIGMKDQRQSQSEEYWIALEILFETEQVTKDYNTGLLRDEVKKSIWDIMVIFSDTFSETGVYFTDEVTDGRSWKATIADGKDIWSFDAAIIPKTARRFYINAPEDFKEVVFGEKLGIIRMSAWENLPWEC